MSALRPASSNASSPTSPKSCRAEIDPERAGEPAAITAADHMDSDAAFDKPSGERQCHRGLARAACDEIADANDRHRGTIGARQRSVQSSSSIPGGRNGQQQIGGQPRLPPPKIRGDADHARTICGARSQLLIGAPSAAALRSGAIRSSQGANRSGRHRVSPSLRCSALARPGERRTSRRSVRSAPPPRPSSSASCHHLLPPRLRPMPQPSQRNCSYRAREGSAQSSRAASKGCDPRSASIDPPIKRFERDGRTIRVHPWCRRDRFRFLSATGSPRPRRATRNPRPASIAAMASPRAGCRGAMIVNSPGCFSGESPVGSGGDLLLAGWVLAASHSWRGADFRRSRHNCA